MSTLSIRLPDFLHNHLRELSVKQHVSMNQLIATALAEKVSALETESYLKDRAKHSDISKLGAILAKVPDVQPEEFDKL